MSTEYDQAIRAAAPELAAIDKTIARIESLGRAAAPRTADELAESLAHDLIAGGELPDPAGVGRRYLAAQEADKHRAAAAQILPDVASHLKSYRSEVKQAAVPGALDHLGKRMQEILDQVRELLPALGDVRTRDAAWSAGPRVRDAWARLEDATAAYEDVRGAQVDLTKLITTYVRNSMGGTLEIQQLVKTGVMEMEGLDQVANFRASTDLVSGSVSTAQPWPTVEFGKSYSPAFVAWIARTPAAKPWIPTVEQMEDGLTRYGHAYEAGKASTLPVDEHDQLYAETR